MRKEVVYLYLLIVTAATCACNNETKDWQSLFDGKTLSGWIIDQPVKDAVYVDDSHIVGTITETMYYLRSEKKYDNFILEVEFKVDSAVNSGVQIRSDFLPEDRTAVYVSGGKDLKSSQRTFKAGDFAGYQIEIETTARGWCGGFYEQSGRGWLQPLNHNEPSRTALKPSDWNHLRIIADKDHFQSWLNGAEATDFHDNKAATGYIGFQMHNSRNEKVIGKKIRFRNIRIKEL